LDPRVTREIAENPERLERTGLLLRLERMGHRERMGYRERMGHQDRLVLRVIRVIRVIPVRMQFFPLIPHLEVFR
jgi:hypothetical protein